MFSGYTTTLNAGGEGPALAAAGGPASNLTTSGPDCGPVETARLVLRLPEVADAGAFMAIFEDPEVVERKQVTLTEPPGGLAVAERKMRETLDHWQSRGYGQWAVVEKATGQVIGCVGLQLPKPRWPAVELVWVFHRSRWGNGFATEAAAAALQWAWTNTTLNYIVSLIAPDNLPSIRIATKLGEQFEREDVDLYEEPGRAGPRVRDSSARSSSTRGMNRACAWMSRRRYVRAGTSGATAFYTSSAIASFERSPSRTSQPSALACR